MISDRVGNIKRMLARDVLLFGKIVAPSTFSVKSADFHYEIVEAYLDETVRRINIQAPRGFAKSTIMAGVVPLHHVFATEDPKRKVVLLSSKTEGHTVRLLDWIKNVIEYSDSFRALYGYHGEHRARVWARNEIILANGSAIVTRGTGQHVVGLKIGEQRPTLIVLDDPEDMNNTKTDEAMEFNLRWLLQTLLPARDAKRGRVIVIGTPQHQRCMVETLNGMREWKTLKYRSLNGDGPLTRDNEKNLRSLWPDMWTVDALLREKESYESVNRVSSFYREYQCEITGDEDQLFKESYIQYWNGDIAFNSNREAFLKVTERGEEKFEEPLIVPVNIFTGIDPASSQQQTADYSVIANVGVDATDNRYIVSYFRQRVPPMRLAEEIMKNYEKLSSVKTQIETVGYQEMLRDYLRRQSLYIPGLEIRNQPRNSKSNRLETLEPYFHGKKVYCKRGMNALVDELLLYPRGSHDDLLDGLYYAFKGIYRPFHTPADLDQDGRAETESRNVRTKSWASA